MAVSRDDEIGALWERDGRNGKFLSGRIKLPDGTDQEIVVFANDRKQPGERTPDWRVYKSQPRDGGQPSMQPNGRGGYQPERPSQARREAAVASQAPTRTGRHSDMARMPVDPDDDLNDRIPF
jgi:hypothetical protein